MKWLTFIIIVFLFGCAKPTAKEWTETNADFFFPFEKESFDWTSVEKAVDIKEKVKFGEARPWLISMYADSYQKNIHALDLNHDGQLDLIYTGPGPVTYYTIISFGNKSDDFSFDGQIVDLQFTDNRVSKIYLTSILGTGAPAVDGQAIINVSFDDNRPIFKTNFKNATIGGTYFPKRMTSYEVEITSDTLIARESPFALDTPYNNFLEMEGNRLGLLTKGTKARIIGEHADSLKNLWLCALIYPRFEIIKFPYLNTLFDSTDRTTRMVWIEDKGIRKVD